MIKEAISLLVQRKDLSSEMMSDVMDSGWRKAYQCEEYHGDDESEPDRW